MMAGDLASLPEDWPITVCEPACVAGAMILSLAKPARRKSGAGCV